MTWTSLHEACLHKQTEAIIRQANQNDEAFQTDDHGATPLHLYCLNVPDNVSTLKALVAANPMAVSDRDMNGDTPIHLLCRNSDIDQDMVEILVQVDSHALSVANKHGYLPLHVACHYATTNTALLTLLIKTNPYALLHHVKIGDFVEVKKRCNTDRIIVDHIIDPNAGLKTRDSIDLRMMQNEDLRRDGGYPLHIALANHAPLNIVELLTHNHGQEVLELANKFGQTPLMVALLSEADVSIVKYLLTICPDALYIPDNNGNLPLHLAATVGATRNAFEILLRPWPRSAKMANGEGLKAIDLAVRHGKCAVDVRNLLASLSL